MMTAVGSLLTAPLASQVISEPALVRPVTEMVGMTSIRASQMSSVAMSAVTPAAWMA